MTHTDFDMRIDALDAGWADLQIVITGNALQYLISCVPNDSLTELVEVAIRALHGQASMVTFSLEPAIANLFIGYSADGLCAIEAEGHRVSLPPKQFARTILRLFGPYSTTETREAYHRSWQYPFPSAALEQLRKLL